MRQGLIQPAKLADKRDEVGSTYPFSAQCKGNAWYVYDARTNGWGNVPYLTAAAAQEAAQRAFEGYNV